MKSKHGKTKTTICHFAFCILHFALFILFPLAISAIAHDVQAAAVDSPKIVAIRVGIADRYKAGLWTQVEVTLQGGSESLVGEVSVIAPDSDGVPGRVSTPSDEPCRLSPGKKTTVRLISRIGRVEGTLTAEFRVGGRVLASKSFDTAANADADHFLPALQFQKLIVVVGESSLGVEEAGKLGGLEAEFRPVTAQVGDIEQLPTNSNGYEGVDAVVLSARPAEYRKLTNDPRRLVALDEWVRGGGRLVLCAGARADEIIARGAGLPLAIFAPGRLDKMVSLHQSGVLESYCGSRSAVLSNVSTAMRAPRLLEVDGVVEAAESDLPLVVRTARGFGQVMFVAADLDRPPFDKWSDRPRLIAKLLDLPADRADESSESAAMMHYGYSDLSGQLRSALDRYEGVELAPFWLVAALIVGYLLVIGPGDYFFLRKFVGRMGWTWVTFPLVVVLVCVGAYALANHLKGNRLQVREVDLVDVDAASGRMRGTAWLNVFSPRTESFDLTMRPLNLDGKPAFDAPLSLAWFGLPGGGLGGMDQRAGTPLLWTEDFRYASALNALSRVPIPVWSSKSFTARWNGPAEACPAAELAEIDQMISGSITNTLPFALEKCVLAYGGSAYELENVAPGEALRIGTMSKRSDLRTFLTGRRAIFGEGNKQIEEVTPYDRSSVDLPYILRAMMFYEAAGARRYTGLWNAYQDFVDLTSLLKADRAILIAQGPSSSQTHPAAELLRDGHPLLGSPNQHQTIYRFVFPVKKEKGG